MKRNILQISLYLLSLTMLVLTGACADDKGNYDYHELIEPEISGIGESINILTYERLQLSPQLGEMAKADSEYEFEWRTIGHDEANTVTVIGESKNLDYEVTLPPGIYTLYFTLTDKSSGLYWRTSCTLTVSDTTSEGWMVLCNDNGRARLDMVSTVTDVTYRDVLRDNGMPTLHGPRKIQWLSSMTDAASPYYLLTDEGATRLSKNGFGWKPEYSMAYEVATGENLAPWSIVKGGFGKLFVSGTQARYCEVMGIDGLYGSVVNKEFAVAPGIGVNIAAPNIYAAVYMLYDTDHKRFMAYCPLLAYNDFGNQEPLQTMDQMGSIATGMQGSSGVTGNAFDSYPEGLDYIYMENTKYDPGNARMGTTYTVLGDGSQRYLYGIQLGDMLLFSDCTFVLGKSYYGDLSQCTDISLAGNLFAFSSLKNYMYYASGSTVYKVDLSTLPLRAEMQFTLPDETITCLKFNLYQQSANTARSYDLVVGSVNSRRMGTLRIYDGLSSEGDFRSVSPTIYSGFSTIVDATYKERIN